MQLKFSNINFRELCVEVEDHLGESRLFIVHFNWVLFVRPNYKAIVTVYGTTLSCVTSIANVLTKCG